MITSIVCQFHLDEDPDERVPGALPETTPDRAEYEGWRQTTHRLFSLDGRPTWICPRCVDALRIRLICEKDDQKAEMERRHQQRIEDYQKKYRLDLQDEAMFYSRKVEDMQRFYARMHGELAGVQETQAEPT